MIGKYIDSKEGRSNRRPLSTVLEAQKYDSQDIGISESNKTPVSQVGQNGLRENIYLVLKNRKRRNEKK